jgi:hypothetical protein
MEDCPAKKKMQRMDGDSMVFDTMYKEKHTCRHGMNFQLQTGHVQSSVSIGVKAEGSVHGRENMTRQRFDE